MLTRRWCQVTLLLAAVWACVPALSGALHQNQILITKPSPRHLHFEFLVSPVLFLHQVMQPRMGFADFLRTYAALPEADFQRYLAKDIRQFEIYNFVQLSSGEKIKITDWRMPEASTLQTLLQKNLLLLDLPPQIQVHMEPIVISASVHSTNNLARIRLIVSPNFYPILVKYQQELIWFTHHIPEALIDL